jgi:hypothetical protein
MSNIAAAAAVVLYLLIVGAFAWSGWSQNAIAQGCATATDDDFPVRGCGRGGLIDAGGRSELAIETRELEFPYSLIRDPSVPNWNFPEFQLAAEAYQKGDCERTWDLMWPLAKSGKFEAIYFLWSTMVDKMLPPGGISADSLARHSLIIAAYAAAGPQGVMPFHGDPSHSWARKEIPLLINQLRLPDPGHRVAQCYELSTSFSHCLKLGLATGVIIPFAEYAASVDREERKTGRRASCLIR